MNTRFRQNVYFYGLHFVGYGEFEKPDVSCKMRSMEYEGILQ